MNRSEDPWCCQCLGDEGRWLFHAQQKDLSSPTIDLDLSTECTGEYDDEMCYRHTCLKCTGALRTLISQNSSEARVLIKCPVCRKEVFIFESDELVKLEIVQVPSDFLVFQKEQPLVYDIEFIPHLPYN